MQLPDLDRWDRVRASLAHAGLDVVVCRLPENVVMLSGYWPVMGRSVVVFPADAEPVLLAPTSEVHAVDRGWIPDVRTFTAWRIGDPDPEESLRRLLGQTFEDKGLCGKRIGFEGTFGDVSPIQRSLEGWAGVHSILASWSAVSGEGEWVDSGPLLVDLAGQKTEREISRLRVANEIADFGLRAFLDATVPGARESDISAAVEAAIHSRGVGHEGVGNARAEAEVISGPRTADAWDFPTSTARMVEDGDLVVIELATVADGYWSDLTRTAVAGHASDEQLRLFSAQRAAYEASFAAMKPGASCRDVDEAGRRALDAFGMRSLFVHHTGHGIGFRYHEPTPFLHPDSTGELHEGMITSLEPGLYGTTFGLRVEDNVVITPSGAECLCGSPRWPALGIA